MAAVDIERDGQVARVWLNRPDQHNALGEEVSNGLITAMKEVGRRPGRACRRARRQGQVLLRRCGHRDHEGVGERHA